MYYIYNTSNYLNLSFVFIKCSHNQKVYKLRDISNSMVLKTQLQIKNFINSFDPMYKDSLNYNSSKWCYIEECEIEFPIQRTLTKGECVLDYDNINNTAIDLLISFLDEINLKFTVWKTSKNGVHIHFWVDIQDENILIELVKYMGKIIENNIGIKNDLQPMRQGFIRAEYSFHPVKKSQKIIIFSSIYQIDYINNVPDKFKETYNYLTKSDEDIKPISGGELTTCMKYILTHKFADGRKRLMFVIASWYKGDNRTNTEIYHIIKDWLKEQDKTIPENIIWATIYSNNGTVGCSYRHELLEELGVDMNNCWRNRK